VTPITFWSFSGLRLRRATEVGGDRRTPPPNISVTTITAISQDQRSAVTAPSLVTDGAYRPNLGPLNGAAPFFVSRSIFRGWEGEVRAFLIAMAIALGGCSSHSSGYARTDGVPVDPLHEQATLAQCKGEAVSGSIDPLQAVAQARKESTIIDRLHGAEWLHSSEAVRVQLRRKA